MQALRQIDEWGAEHAAVAVVTRDGRRGSAFGATGRMFEWASVTKVATALVTLVAIEEGIVDLDEPAGPPGSTVRHLLAHASGLPLDAGDPIARPATRRIYSNSGFEHLAELVATAAEMPFDRYFSQVLRPVDVYAELRGSAAWGVRGRIEDLAGLATILLNDEIIAAETLAEATTVQFAGLAGVLPGFGRTDPNDWGLGFELRNGKSPHWTGARNSAGTFGHFGRSGTFLWVDPDAEIALACLTDREFGDWAKEAWPRLSDAVLEEA